MKNKKFVLIVSALIAVFASRICYAASVDVQICVSATVVEQMPYEVVFGDGSLCASVSGGAVAVVPGETIVFDDTDDNYGPIAGGGNDSGTAVDYTIRFDWTYSINTSTSGSNETATGLVRSDFLGIEFTSGSGNGSKFVTDTLPDGFFVDYFADVFASGHATSFAPVPLPAGVWLFASGITMLLAFTRRARKFRSD
jgi:hypothetical protein